MSRDTRHDERTEITSRRRSADEPSAVVEPVADYGVSVSQVVAGALAAVTAAAVGSTLGVAGTFIGAAVASVIATVGSALYSAWLSRGREVVLRTARVGTQRLPVAVPVRRLRPRLADLPWKSIAAVTAASLMLGLAVLTAAEVVAGQRVGGDGGGGGGRTSVGELVGGGSDTKAPGREQEQRAPQDGPAQEPQPSEEPTQAEPTEEPTPTGEPAPTGEPTPTEPTEEPTEEPSEAPTEAPTPEG